VAITPASFADPNDFPVVFRASPPAPAVLATRIFPVAFAFASIPQPARLLSLAVREGGRFWLDRDIFSHADVVVYERGLSRTFTLQASGADLLQAAFHLEAERTRDTPRLVLPGKLLHVRQPQYGADVSHLFAFAPSTRSFNPVAGLYPSVGLNLHLQSALMNGSALEASQVLPNTGSAPQTSVLLSPANVTGLIDVTAEMRVNWYSNPERSTAYGGEPPVDYPLTRFGLRLYLVRTGLFHQGISLDAEAGGGVANGLTALSSLEPPVGQALFYWGQDANETELFAGSVTGLTVADSGLPVQDGQETAVYKLPNPLAELQSSSSSSSSS
jgi:hypothetical protein